MLYKNCRYLLLIVFFTFISMECWVFAKNANIECVFDPEYFTKKKYQSFSDVEYVKWIDKVKEAQIITRTGGLMSIKHWSCSHLGLEAKMYFKNRFKDTTTLKQKLVTFVKIILNQTNFIKVKDKILKYKFIIHGTNRLDFLELGYSEFYLSVESVSDTTIFELKYYRD